MKPGILNDTGKSAKQLAQQIAKQLAEEPEEIIREASDQVFYQPAAAAENNNTSDLQSQQELENNIAKSEAHDLRSVAALESEIKDIKRNKIMKDLQERIYAGEEISLVDITELTPEQKQVLQAQMGAIKQRIATEQNSSREGISITSKRPRGLFTGMGQKKQAQDLQTRIEKPMPPTG